MWDNTHFLHTFFTLHWDYLWLLKAFLRSTITAINHGGRNCHRFQNITRGADLQIRICGQEGPFIMSADPRNGFSHGFTQFLRSYQYYYYEQLHVKRSWFIKHYLQHASKLYSLLLDYPKQCTLIWHNLDCSFVWKIHFW